MSISREDKKREAISRLQLWGVASETIERLEKNDSIVLCDSDTEECRPLTAEELAQVQAFEAAKNALVYYVIHNSTPFGEFYSYLFVGNYQTDWEMEREDIQRGSQIAYVLNLTALECSEFGYIGVERNDAQTLIRTW